MKKLLSALIVTFSLISSSAVMSAEYSIGVGISDGAFYGYGKETNTVALTEEAGVFEAGYGVIFGEMVVNDRVSVGIEFVPGDFSTPTNTNLRLDKTTSATASSVNNTARASFEDLMTAYVQANIWGGTYAKLGIMHVTIQTNEALGTGGTYGDVDTTGVVFGLGYNHDLEAGMFVRLEVQAMEFEDVNASNSTDSTKKVSVSEMMGAQGSIRIGKTF